MPMEPFNRTQLRLASWYALVMGAILGLCGLVSYQVTIRAYSDSMERELETVAKTLYAGIELHLKQPGRLEPFVEKLLPDVCLTDAPCLVEINPNHSHSFWKNHHIPSKVHQNDYYIRFLDSSNKLVAVSGLRVDLPTTMSSPNWQTVVDSQGKRFHQIAFPLHTLDNKLWGYLQVGRSLKDLDSRLAALKLVLLVGLPITVILIGVSSWWLAGKAVRPIYRSYLQMQQFTADVAHELRTPLTAILATLDSALRLSNVTEPEVRDTLKTIERQVNRFFELIKDLLLLSRLEQHTLDSNPQSLCLNDLMSDLIEEFSALAASVNLKLVSELRSPEPLYIFADEDQICRLFSNLIINAIQYTAPGGCITLKLSKEDRHAVFEVQDTGIGISLDAQTYIFDRFYRVQSDRSRQTGGTGLGLSIARAIAEGHGGSIRVQSEVGKGSTFTIRLPVEKTLQNKNY
ncbi:two-component sensor histidine kinase [Aphanothece hegewaldii CCALA 016]|uniref:histidine kinase n=2 Tax=Aphanothece TaxID=1121 RepID=A0A2T1LSN2_9CHRO|nr:two-component sensor histidine kinase [Aphanothece hegewaldii CCALA 016]